MQFTRKSCRNHTGSKWNISRLKAENLHLDLLTNSGVKTMCDRQDSDMICRQQKA